MMGVPDYFHFDVLGKGKVKSATQMIGNSIPIPLTTALHRPFLECRIRQFVKERDSSEAERKCLMGGEKWEKVIIFNDSQ